MRACICLLVVAYTTAIDCSSEYENIVLTAVYNDEVTNNQPCFGWHGNPSTQSESVASSLTVKCGMTPKSITIPFPSRLHGGETMEFSVDNNGQAWLKGRNNNYPLGTQWPIDRCLESYTGFFCKGVPGECKLRIQSSTFSYTVLISGIVGGLAFFCFVTFCCAAMYRRNHRRTWERQKHYQNKRENHVTTTVVSTTTAAVAMPVVAQPSPVMAQPYVAQPVTQPYGAAPVMQPQPAYATQPGPAYGAEPMQQPYGQPAYAPQPGPAYGAEPMQQPQPAYAPQPGYTPQPAYAPQPAYGASAPAAPAYQNFSSTPAPGVAPPTYGDMPPANHPPTKGY